MIKFISVVIDKGKLDDGEDDKYGFNLINPDCIERVEMTNDPKELYLKIYLKNRELPIVAMADDEEDLELLYNKFYADN
jgi:hypothetical protein